MVPLHQKVKFLACPKKLRSTTNIPVFNKPKSKIIMSFLNKVFNIYKNTLIIRYLNLIPINTNIII